MLIHANSEPRIPSGFCCVGSAPAPGRAAVRAGRIAGRGGAAVGRDDCGRESLVSDLARRGAEGAESGGPGGPQAAAPAAGVARGRKRAAGPPPRTWAPRGETPILTPTGGNWKRLSIAGALAFRWDGRRSRFFFQTHAGSYTDGVLITFVQALHRHFRGGRVILIWHKSRRMLDFLRRQRRWLTVERLPAYATDLNPVEQVWGTVKTCELANVCAPDLTTLRTPLRRGL